MFVSESLPCVPQVRPFCRKPGGAGTGLHLLASVRMQAVSGETREYMEESQSSV